MTGIEKVRKVINRRGEEKEYRTVGGSVKLGGNENHYHNGFDFWD